MKRPEIIIAMDVPDRASFHESLRILPSSCTWLKIGLELFCAEGPSLLNEIDPSTHKIFLDLKLHDIPRTVERAVESIRKFPISLLTLHASGGEAMLKAAVSAAQDSDIQLLAVTVLTSLDEQDLQRQTIINTPGQQVLDLASLAQQSGVHGVVSSPREARTLRDQSGEHFLIVTPGIRPSSTTAEDQKRIATPRDAVLAGASHLVIGRPILGAADPEAAYEAILQEMIEATKEGS